MERPVVYTLFSGSSGNAAFFRYGDTRILIDAGKNAKAVTQALDAIGESPADLDAILITHEHVDHIRGLQVLAKRYRLPVYMTLPTARAVVTDAASPLADLLCVREAPFTEQIKGVTVTAFPVPHDSAACVGYLLDTPAGRVGIATDIGYPTRRLVSLLSTCDGVILEANYDPDMLQNGPYPYPLKQRILSEGGHMSNPDSARCVCALAKERVCAVLLAHISAENNTPECAISAVTALLGQEQLDRRCTVRAADRHTPTCLW